MASLFYYLLFALAWTISLIPYRVLYLISDVLYLIIYYIVGYRKKTVLYNLRSSFPEKTEEEIKALAKAFYRHFSDFLLEIFKLIRIPEKQLDKRMKFLNPEVFDELSRENKNYALVSSHYNNWEMLINLPLKTKHRFLVIYRPLSNKVTNRISNYMRTRHHTIMIPMENIFREALKCRSEKQLFSIWFIADQRPPKNSQFWTRFLNHDAAFFEGVEKMSKKLEMAVIYLHVQKVRRGFYEVTLEKLFDNAAGTAPNEVTLTCVKKMEYEIIERPEFWLWSHNRFKHRKPENIKLIAS